MWIPVTLMAATFQILRTSRQHQLANVLTATGAGFVRYLYGAPLALAASVCWFAFLGHSLPTPTTRFWVFVVAAGVGQIAATVALLQSFRTRDFAIGTVYAKTEVIQVAVFGYLVIGEPLQPAGWLGAAICTAGVVWLASRRSVRALLRRAGDPAAILGVVAGGLFGLAAVGIRGASTALEPAGALDRALFTLTAMLTVQTLINGTYLTVRDRHELVRTILHGRSLSVSAC
jgi:drug/metabolite transporter (DMT)-like permease